jgi:hypothetical protein
MVVFVIPANTTEVCTVRLALLLGAHIRYGASNCPEKDRQRQLLAGLPILPFDAQPASNTAADVAAWVRMQPKCVFLDATLATITQPLLAFPDVHQFVFINWAARGLDASQLREKLRPLGYEWVYIDGNMMRFAGNNRVVDVHVGVPTADAILAAIAGFTHLFITERTPGNVFTDTASPDQAMVVGSTRNAVCADAFVHADKWVLLTDKMEVHSFDSFEKYKSQRDFIIV